jgi:hypothetical protein
VKTPPITGPITIPRDETPITSPIYIGRLSIGTDAARMLRNPVIRPEAPEPEIARPTINIAELLASADINEPSSKIATPHMKTV